MMTANPCKTLTQEPWHSGKQTHPLAASSSWQRTCKHLQTPAHPHFTRAQGVTYFVPDADLGNVCKNTPTSQVSWRNQTDPTTGMYTLEPTHTMTSVNNWAYDCNFRPTPDHPHGQFCHQFKNPGAVSRDRGGYNNFDNILLSWLAVFQHVSSGSLYDSSGSLYRIVSSCEQWVIV